VEAVETEFIPLLIHNNRPGKDAEILRRFDEPAWNYQVVRFLNAEGQDIIPRKDGVWDTAGIAERTVTTLKKAGRPVPGYLTLLAAEHSSRLQQVAFSMPCFWTGERMLGQIEGVIRTEAGFLGGREVALVTYDPTVVSFDQLVAQAEKVDCAHSVHRPVAGPQGGSIPGYRAAPASDQKKQISGTRAASLKLSPAQSTKVNAWIRTDLRKAVEWLSPSQRRALGV
jgi:hypothetical protein